MRTLLLLRHAKSSWEDASLPDDARPLSERGRRAAGRMHAHLRKRGVTPDKVICSPSERTRETASLVLRQPVELRDEVYLAEADQLRALIAGMDDSLASLLLIAHNPGLEELTGQLCGRGRKKALRRLGKGFKTCSLAEIELDVERWSDVVPGCGRLRRFTRPRDLSEADRDS